MKNSSTSNKQTNKHGTEENPPSNDDSTQHLPELLEKVHKIKNI